VPVNSGPRPSAGAATTARTEGSPADGQQLRVEGQLALKLIAISRSPPLETLGVADARAQVAADARALEGRKCSVARVDEITVACAAGSLGARLSVPDRAGEPAGYEYRFPAAIDDALAAFRYAVQHAAV